MKCFVGAGAGPQFPVGHYLGIHELRDAGSAYPQDNGAVCYRVALVAQLASHVAGLFGGIRTQQSGLDGGLFGGSDRLFQAPKAGDYVYCPGAVIDLWGYSIQEVHHLLASLSQASHRSVLVGSDFQLPAALPAGRGHIQLTHSPSPFL